MPEERRNVQTSGAIGGYSSAVVAGGFCFVSGQAALDVEGKRLPGGIREQTAATIKNLESVLVEAAFGLADVVQVTCYLNDIANWSEMDEVFSKYFAASPPARATVQAELIHGCLVEMVATAWKPS
jgi:2-iminobutanoate/2-iminopropanoate deaminase